MLARCLGSATWEPRFSVLTVMGRRNYRLRCPVRRRKNARGVLRLDTERGRDRGWSSCLALGALGTLGTLWTGDHGRGSWVNSLTGVFWAMREGVGLVDRGARKDLTLSTACRKRRSQEEHRTGRRHPQTEAVQSLLP